MRNSGFHIVRVEWNIWLFFSLAVFFIASVLMSGWPDGLIPNVRYPYTYQGDGLLSLILIQEVIEGPWIFFNHRLGYPFGCNMLDFPIPDTGSLIVLKGLGMFFGSSHAAMNLYFLIGFPVTFICSYVFLRIIGVSRSFSVTAALLFVLLPFHFQRLSHLYYTWYFVVPIFLHFGFKLFRESESLFQIKTRCLQTIRDNLTLFFLGFFGVYYAFFGCLVLCVSAFAGTIKNHSPKNLITGFAMIALVFLGVLVNVVPNIQHKIMCGTNPEVAQRLPRESEIAGLKLVQMLLPRVEHRAERLRDVAAWYLDHFLPVGESQTSALGFIGASGFILLLFVGLLVMSGSRVDMRLVFFSITMIFLFFFATVGGFSTVFAIGVSPLLRSWNRLSVFIGFEAIAGFFLILQIKLENSFSKERVRKRAMLFMAFGLGILGFLDQTSPIPAKDNEFRSMKFERDREFIKRIEAMVPPQSGIYQMPYMPFPESSPAHDLDDYGLAIGFLHSNSLCWSYGSMRGRDGDRFFRRLINESVQKQVAVITKLGFAGVFIDRRGFEDHGYAVEAQLREILGTGPQLQSADGDFAFFRISHPYRPLPKS